MALESGVMLHSWSDTLTDDGSEAVGVAVGAGDVAVGAGAGADATETGAEISGTGGAAAVVGAEPPTSALIASTGTSPLL